MKKYLALLLALVMALGICACAKQAAPAGEGSAPAGEGSAAEEAALTGADVNLAVLAGPTGIGAAGLMEANDAGETVNHYTFTVASAPEDVVSGVANGSLDMAAVPTNLASTLYAKTEGGVQVAALNTYGVLYILENGDTVQSLADLKGKTVYATGQGSNPEYILNYVIKQNGLDDVTVSYEFTVDELTAKIVSGDVQTIMVPEPKATAIKGQLKKAEKEFTVTDLQAEWNKVCDTPIAQGVVVVRADWLSENEGAFRTFLNDFKASSDAALNDLDNTVAAVVELGVIPNEALAKQAIPNCNIVSVTGEDMKKSVSGFINVLLEADPQSVGGAAPDDGFYYVG